jgi:hypothetical protein
MPHTGMASTVLVPTQQVNMSKRYTPSQSAQRKRAQFAHNKSVRVLPRSQRTPARDARLLSEV